MEIEYIEKAKSNIPLLGGGMKEGKRVRDYKSKPALGFSSETSHLKDMDSLGHVGPRQFPTQKLVSI